MTGRSTLGQFVRFGLVGLASNGLLYAAYLVFTNTGMGPKLAMSLLYATGVIQTFLFNKRWSFRHGGAHGPAFARYCLAYGLGYLINLFGLYLFIDLMHYPHWLTQGAMIIIVSMFIFLAQKKFVFNSVGLKKND